MHTLRRARLLARIVLAWFVLSLGVAVASPVFNPQSMELICSGSGAIKVIVKTDDGAKELSTVTLDCPLCATAGGPPPADAAIPTFSSPLGRLVQPIPSARLAALVSGPPPARGPPASA